MLSVFGKSQFWYDLGACWKEKFYRANYYDQKRGSNHQSKKRQQSSKWFLEKVRQKCLTMFDSVGERYQVYFQSIVSKIAEAVVLIFALVPSKLKSLWRFFLFIWTWLWGIRNACRHLLELITSQTTTTTTLMIIPRRGSAKQSPSTDLQRFITEQTNCRSDW